MSRSFTFHCNVLTGKIQSQEETLGEEETLGGKNVAPLYIQEESSKPAG